MKKGDVYYADLDPVIGCEQNGKRPVVIVQNNKGNKYSSTTLIAPITNYRNYKQPLPTHVFIKRGNGIKIESIIMLEQIKVIDKTRLGKYITSLDEEIIKEIDEAMLISLELIGGKNEKE